MPMAVNGEARFLKYEAGFFVRRSLECVAPMIFCHSPRAARDVKGVPMELTTKVLRLLAEAARLAYYVEKIIRHVL